MIVRSVVVSLALIVVLRVSPPAWGGELFDSSQWKDHDPTAVGSIAFSDLMSIGNIDIGATVAYVDLFGSAESLSLYTANKDASGGIPSLLGPPWLHLVATASAPKPLNGGWTRFEFRDLKLVDIGPKLLDGVGPYFRIQNGTFSEVAGFEQHPGQEGSSVEYFETLTRFAPNGSLPVYRVIWETLDAPYVSRQGDANRDGKTDLTDFGALKANLGKHFEPWTVADFTGDGIVNGIDFDLLQQNFGHRDSNVVAEPPGGLLLLVGALVLAVCRRLRQSCFYGSSRRND